MIVRVLAVCFVVVVLFGDALVAQAPQDKPFVEYEGSVARYLQRLHGKPGPLAWRADFPGGLEAWQQQARAKLKELLGLDVIAESCAGHRATVKLDAPIEEDGYQRFYGELQSEPDVTIPFWMLVPGKSLESKRPLAICAHGHDQSGWNAYAGVYENESHRQETEAKDGNAGVQAVRQGYVAIVPATRGLAASPSIPDPKKRHGGRACRAQLIHCLLAGRTAVGERVWDIQRILDWSLNNLSNVDPERVVMLGNSGGGVLTVYAAALDPRIKLAAPSCSFSSFTSSTGFVFHCDCCLVPRAQSELGDLADVGGLTVPRALCVVHGKQDTLHSYSDVESAMKRVRDIYRHVDAVDKFHVAWGESGHKFYPELMWPFIEKEMRKANMRERTSRD